MSSTDLIPLVVARSLCDRTYQKRKVGAQKIEAIVKEFIDAGRFDSVQGVIEKLTEYCSGANPPDRKGGLMGIASVSVVLGYGLIGDYLDALLSPSLVRFDDRDSSVRFFACEALYNICKVARDQLIPDHFGRLFTALGQMASELDESVEKAAMVLDRLCKDIAIESKNFDINSFTTMLSDRVSVINTSLRRFLLSWISTVLSCGMVNLVSKIPQILDSLLIMLDSDVEGDTIVAGIESTMVQLLQITLESGDVVDIDATVAVLHQWLHHSAVHLVTIRALDWSLELCGAGLVDDYMAGLVKSSLELIESSDESTVELACQLNEKFKARFMANPSRFSSQMVMLETTLDTIMSASDSGTPSKVAAVAWATVLLAVQPDATLAAAADAQVDLTAAVLRGVAGEPDIFTVTLPCLRQVLTVGALDDEVPATVARLLAMWTAHWPVVTPRIPTIIRLCLCIGADRFLLVISQCLAGMAEHGAQAPIVEEDRIKIIDQIGLLLLTAKEFAPVRGAIGKRSDLGDRIYDSLTSTWAASPIMACGLHLLGRRYGAAHAALMDVPPDNLESLVLLDKLVQLIESPTFTHVRLDMLHQNRDLSLVLLSMAAILPVGSASKLLTERLGQLQTVSVIRFVDTVERERGAVNDQS